MNIKSYEHAEEKLFSTVLNISIVKESLSSYAVQLNFNYSMRKFNPLKK